MTARRAFLSNFWVGTKGGLLTAKHIRKMGMARWLFDYLTRGQTSVNKDGVGVFQYGHPVTLEQIAFDMSEGEDNMPVRTVRRWLSTLKREGYITTESHSGLGLTIWINKAKDKTKKPRTQHNLAATNGRESKELAATSGQEIETSRPHFVKESPQAIETPAVAAPIPKGSISKGPSYYNKPAAAKTAAVECVSLKELAKAKTMPRGKSEAELDATRRELLQQDEKLRRKHPDWYKQPGQVIAIRKEAMA